MADQMSVTELIEAPDHWVLPLDGSAVVQCRVDFAFTVLAEGPEGTFELRVEQPFEWFAGTDGGAALSIDVAGDPTAAGPALACLNKGIRGGTAFKDGRLELRFEDGLELRVQAGEDYEPWTLTGPGGLRVVSAPGGELSIWSPGDGGDGGES
jgi:Family of unknown function (DUF6188)